MVELSNKEMSNINGGWSWGKAAAIASVAYNAGRQIRDKIYDD